MKNLLSLFLALWMITPLLSQTIGSTGPVPSPQLLVKGDAPKEPLTITGFSAEVTINGFIAETKITMTFFNPYSRVLEGDFNFPLPEGSFVSGYALDIYGVMVDGVVVEKQKGRVVFEKIVRRGIDPGLVEWVEGNNFRTRIFPIPAKGTRTISIKYLSEIVFKSQKALYYLPLHFKKNIEDFSIRVEVIETGQKPEIPQGKPANFQFTRWHSGFRAETSLKNYLPPQDLIIALPGISRQNVRVEQDPEGDYFFSIHDDIKKDNTIAASNPKEPGHITILWDASNSMGKYNHQEELQLLETYLSNLKKQHITVDLVLFHHRREKSRRFNLDKNSIDALIKAIAGIQYDGGTSLAALSPLNTESIPDFYLLFSDGRNSFSEDEAPGFKAPVYAFSGSSLANHALLRYIARQSGGIYFNLNTLDRQTILKKIGSSPYSFISAVVNNGSVSQIFPQSSQPVYDGFVIAGQLVSAQAEITLNYGINGKIMRRVSFTVSREEAAKGNRLRTYWAQKKIAELQAFPGRYHRELLETGKKYGLVTPGTSLIVLDSLGQYLEHKIMPPESLLRLREAYIRQMNRRKKETQEEKEGKLNRLIELWNKRISWWKTSYPLGPEKPKKKQGIQARNPWIVLNKLPGVMVGRDDIGGGEEDDITWNVDGANVTDPSAVGAVPAYLNTNAYDVKSPAGPAISLKAWDPGTPYLKRLKKAGPAAAYAAYIKQKQEYGNAPSFYLDCADYFFKIGKTETGLRVLSNIAEMDTGNPALLRVLGYRLRQLNHLELSSIIFEKVLKLRPEEPQSYRDLALVLERMGKFTRAADLLVYVINHHWDDRFREIEVIVLMELNHLLQKAKKAGIKGLDKKIDPRLRKLLQVDIRIVLTWDADMTDMDLWVIDPRGEKSFYENALSHIGGLMSRDFTRGYGPEEFVLKKAPKGEYKIKVNYFSSRSFKLLGSITLQVDIFTDYGRKSEKRKSLTLRLKQEGEEIDVDSIQY